MNVPNVQSIINNLMGNNVTFITGLSRSLSGIVPFEYHVKSQCRLQALPHVSANTIKIIILTPAYKSSTCFA